MLQISENKSLKMLNTFGIEASARWFAEVNSIDEIREVLRNKEIASNGILIMGGGSNLLFTRNFNGLVIKNCLKGISIVDENDTQVKVKAGSGEVWHDFVMWCISKGYAG